VPATKRFEDGGKEHMQRRGIFPVVVLIMVGHATAARAGSDKSDYPGSFCVPADYTGFARGWYSASYSYIENDKSCNTPPYCWYAYLCPAVNHEPSINGSGHWMLVQTWGGTIYGYLYRRDPYTGSGGVGGSDASEHTDGTVDILEPTTSYTGSFTYGITWLAALLPDDQYSPRILAYALNEYV
jgi:hypothetical protein